MKSKLIILSVALISVLICISPIMASENNALFDYALFLGENGSHDSLSIENLIIEKVKTEHTDSSGKTDKKTDYFLKFNVKSDAKSFGNYSIKIDCLDKKNVSLKSVDSYVDKEGSIKIPLDVSSDIAGVNVTIKDSNGNVLYQNFTSKIKTTENVTKDKPVEKTKTSSSSSGSTFWASSNSGKFHKPSCEWAQKISGKNKVVFHSRDEAISSGYSPCSVCNP